MSEEIKDNYRSKTIGGFFWRMAERLGNQLLTFVVSIILARLLDPSTYGVLALVTVFTSIIGIFLDCGLGSALVQKKDAADLEFSTVFYFNVVMSVVLYAILFFVAPAIADFYEMSELTEIVRVTSLSLFVAAIRSTQTNYVTKHMEFKLFFFSTLGSTIAGAAVGIWLAFAGYGVWALVFQNLVGNIAGTIILWFTVKWRPKLLFSWKELGGLLSFGWKLLASQLLDTVYNNLRQLIIGKLYTTSDLAFYNKGNNFPSTVITAVDSSLNSVLFPVMSAVQDDRERVKSMVRRAIKTSTVVIMPLMVGLGVCAEPLIELLLTDKWLPAVPFMRIFCFTYAFYPIHTSNLNAINALGRSDIFLKLEVIKKAMGLIVLVSTMWWGVMVMAYSLLLTSILSQIINAWPNKKLLNYGYLQQLRDIMPAIGMACLMGVLIFPLSLLPLSSIVILLLQFFLGAAIYLGGCWLFKIEAFTYLVDMVKPVLQRKFGKGKAQSEAAEADSVHPLDENQKHDG